MSQEAAKAFIERMKSDEAFRARVMAEEGVEARMALITAEGFDCSAEEIGALQEMNEAELDGVAGGGWNGPAMAYAMCDPRSMLISWETCSRVTL